jgi:hypothetical protein
MAAINSKYDVTTTAYSTAATLSVTRATLSAPIAPTGVAVDGSSSSITVSLTGVANASSYTARIYLASDTSTALQTLTGFTSGSAIASLEPATSYKVTIEAIGDGVSFSNSSASLFSASITTNKALLTTPAAPTLITTANTHKSLTLSWSAVTHATSYTIALYNSTGSNILATVTGVTGTTKIFDDSDYASIEEATGYKVSITAIGDSQYTNSSESSLSSLATTINALAVAPSISSQPTNLTRAANATATFTVTATASDGGSVTYQWQVRINSDASWVNVSTGSGGTSRSYTTASIAIADNGYQFHVVITNTYLATTATTTSNTVTLTVTKANQSSLSVTSRDGVLGTPLTLTVSGGSSGGAVTYVVTNGTASGCIFPGSVTTSSSPALLSSSTSGTCSVTATMAANTTYNSVSSSPTSIRIISTPQSVAVTVTNSTKYQSEVTITVVVGTAGTVEFLQNGKTIPECAEVRATVTSPATCKWKPSTQGIVSIIAEVTPTNRSIAVTRSAGIPVRVAERD